MSALAEKLLTADEFEATVGDEPWFELVDGKVVERIVPTKKHRDLQENLRNIFMQLLADSAVAFVELNFRVSSQWQQWRADVAVYDKERWTKLPEAEVPWGAPDLLVEVLSPSNNVLKSNRRRQICLENGCREYWDIDPDLKMVEVATDKKVFARYHCGESIPLTAFPGTTVRVDSIFE